MPDLFDMALRARRRDRAARTGPELFLYDRAFEDCLERIALLQRRFDRALLIGCPDPTWPGRLSSLAARIDVRDPGPLFAAQSGGEVLIEDAWEPSEKTYDLILAVGTFDTVNDLPLALRLVRYAMRGDALFIAAASGGDTLPRLRAAMRAADSIAGAAAAHVHPRLEASALAPLLTDADFVDAVVDLDRVAVSYPSFERIIADLRRMSGTNILKARPQFIGRAAREAASRAFEAAGEDGRTVETFEILHVAAWTTKER